MPKRRNVSRLLLLASSCVVWALLEAGSPFLLPTAAGAGPLEDLTGPVNEVTAPVREAVEQVVPPVTAPSPAPDPPAVQLPKAKVPAVPVKPPPARLAEAPAKSPTPPLERAASSVEATTEAVTDSAGAVTSTGNAAANGTQSAAGEATAAAEQTVESASAGAESVLDAPRAAASAATAGPQKASGGSSAGRSTAASGGAPAADAGATAAPNDFSSMVSPGIPARLLRPFIRVWPAIALVTERPLGALVGHWSRSVLALLEGTRSGSPPGEGEGALAVPALPGPPPAAHSAEQPPFSWLTSPARGPFNWVGNESALVVLALILAAGASTLVMLALGRRELGLPMFRRGNRFPWRH